MRFPQETTDNINKIFETATEDGRDCLYEYEVYGILKEIGLDVPEFVMVERPSLVGRHYQDFVSIMEENGLPVFADIRSAIKSLDRFVSYYIPV